MNKIAWNRWERIKLYQTAEIALRPSKLFETIKLDKKVTFKIVRKVVQRAFTVWL